MKDVFTEQEQQEITDDLSRVIATVAVVEMAIDGGCERGLKVVEADHIRCVLSSAHEQLERIAEALKI